MFISRGCLGAILENLSKLNKEVERLEKITYSGRKPDKQETELQRSHGGEVVEMKKIMNLAVVKTLNGEKLILDGKEINHVASYLIESTDISGTVELTIRMLANYPVSQESV